MLKLAILISGRGSNLRSILQAIATRTLIGTNAKVVISNNPQARGIAIAKQFNIATEILSPSGLRGWSYDKRLVSLLEKYDVSPKIGRAHV